MIELSTFVSAIFFLSAQLTRWGGAMGLFGGLLYVVLGALLPGISWQQQIFWLISTLLMLGCSFALTAAGNAISASRR